MFFIFTSKEQHFGCECITIQLFFHIFLAKNEAFIISWDNLFYALLIKVHVLCYQPPHNNCFHLMIMLKFVVTKGSNQMITTQ